MLGRAKDRLIWRIFPCILNCKSVLYFLEYWDADLGISQDGRVG